MGKGKSFTFSIMCTTGIYLWSKFIAYSLPCSFHLHSRNIMKKLHHSIRYILFITTPFTLLGVRPGVRGQTTGEYLYAATSNRCSFATRQRYNGDTWSAPTSDQSYLNFIFHRGSVMYNLTKKP
jgi:hypothetical protein